MKTLYRILAPVMGVLSVIGLYFLPILHIAVTSSLTENLMSSLGLKEYYSLNTLVKAIAGGDDKSNTVIKTIIETVSDKDSTIGAMFTNKGWLIAFAVFFVITVVIIIVMSIFSAVSKKPLIGTCLSGAAIISAILMNKMFDNFAAPLLSGKIGISSILSGASESLSSLASMFGSMVSMTALQLSFAYSAVVGLMVIVLIIGLCAVFEKKYEK